MSSLKMTLASNIQKTDNIEAVNPCPHPQNQKDCSVVAETSISNESHTPDPASPQNTSGEGSEDEQINPRSRTPVQTVWGVPESMKGTVSQRMLDAHNHAQAKIRKLRDEARVRDQERRGIYRYREGEEPLHTPMVVENEPSTLLRRDMHPIRQEESNRLYPVLRSELLGEDHTTWSRRFLSRRDEGDNNDGEQAVLDQFSALNVDDDDEDEDEDALGEDEDEEDDND